MIDILQSFVVHKSGGIWRKSWERPTPIDPWQMLAALALSTVADSLMRVLRNAAYLMLYSYNRAVVRTQVGGSGVVLTSVLGGIRLVVLFMTLGSWDSSYHLAAELCSCYWLSSS